LSKAIWPRITIFIVSGRTNSAELFLTLSQSAGLPARTRSPSRKPNRQAGGASTRQNRSKNDQHRKPGASVRRPIASRLASPATYLIRRARQAETASHVSEWLRSPGLIVNAGHPCQRGYVCGRRPARRPALQAFLPVGVRLPKVSKHVGCRSAPGACRGARRMSAAMSVLFSAADITYCKCHVRLVPTTEVIAPKKKPPGGGLSIQTI